MSTLFNSEITQALINTAIATLILGFVLFLFGVAFPWILKKIRSSRNSIIRPIKFRNFEVVSSTSLVSGLCGFVNTLRVVGTLIAIYIYLSLVFGFFPETQDLSHNMFDYVMNPLKEVLSTFLNYVPKAIYILIICLVVRYVLKVINLFFMRVEGGYITIEGFHQDWAKPTYNIVRIMVFCFTLIILFPHLPGSSSPAFQGISVFLGLLISLGSGSAISNLVSGIVITYMRPFKVGDRVKIGDSTGDVMEKNLLVTRVRTIKNIDITIPNSTVLGSHMMNYSAVAESKGLILNSRVMIGYDTDWRQVHELLISAALRTEGVLSDPKPFILQTALGTSAVEYEINVYTHLANQFDNIYSDLRRNIQDCFFEARIEIMSPSYVALRDANNSHDLVTRPTK